MKISEETYQYRKNWNKENLKRIAFDVPLDLAEDIKKHIALVKPYTNESQNAFIKRAVLEAMQHDRETYGITTDD